MIKPLLLSVALALAVGGSSHGSGDVPPTNQQRAMPDFRVQVLGYIVADFSARVQDYYDLRARLETGLPALAVTEDPREISAAERALAHRIRQARSGAGQGDIFTSAVRVELRRVLRVTITTNTWAAIMDDNPGEFSHHVNDTYSKGRTLSTVPPTVLAVLPALPDDIEYRFVGRRLILRDTRANVIPDWMPAAIRCPECRASSGDR